MILTSRERFLAACFPGKAAAPLGRPPLWIMRQAGRYLPEYREIKQRSSFLEMVRTPEIAAEVTLQPLRRFPALDAAILFSDILVIPEALGLPYAFRDGGGIQMARRLASRADIDALAPAQAVPEKLSYVAAALRLVKRELSPAPASTAAMRHSAFPIPHSTKALLGFGGSPWTLAAYMLEGGGSDDFARAKELFHADRSAFDALLGKLTAALIVYFKMQIAAGADAIQIFDSWGGILAAHDYEAASLRWIREIVAALPADFPVILYARGTAAHHAAQAASGVRVLSVDWTADLAALRRELPEGVALQGNLDPALMQTTPGIVRREALRLLQSMRGLPGGHIFNLGHGITPRAKIECVHALADTVAGFSP